MKQRTSLSVVVVFLLALPAGAQQLSVVVQMDPHPSPYLSDWRSKSNTVMLIVTNPTGVTQEVRLDAYVEGDKRGRVAETKLNAPAPPLVIPPGPSTLNAVSAHVLEEGAVRYVGSSANEAMMSGRLPEDNYRLCVRLVKYTAPEQPLSPEMCARFEIKLLQPPDLIAPTNAGNVTGPPSFQWTAVPMGTGTFAEYEVTLAQLEQGQTNPAQAIETNAPLYQRTTTIPTYQHLPSDPGLEAGKKYVWRVRAFDPQNRYTFAHDGKSAVWMFVWQPGMTLKPALVDKTAEKIKPGLKPKVKEDPHISLALEAVLKNCTLTGRYLYSFEKAGLNTEMRVGEFTPVLPPHGSATRGSVRFASVRLVRRYKTVPFMNQVDAGVDDMTTGKRYNTAPKTIATGHTDADGNFRFQFIEGDSTIICQGHKLHTGGWTTEFQETSVGKLLKYYTVEIVDPRYCTSNYQIAIEPGETKDLILTSLVRTYNLEVQVRDAWSGAALGPLCNVYVARPAKNMVPVSTPLDEGNLGADDAGPIQSQKKAFVNIDDPKSRFTNNSLGYVISFGYTGDLADSGRVLFKRLVRNTKGSDGYYLSARTPIYLPGGETLNDLYYENADRADWVCMPSKYTDDDLFDPAYDYSGEVVYNVDFTIPTFKRTLQIIPRPPRFLGRVKRSDSDSDLVDIKVSLWKYATSEDPMGIGQFTFSESDGQFELANIPVSGTNWHYHLAFESFGFKTLLRGHYTAQYGKQTPLGVFRLDPRVNHARRVVDEGAAPLPGVQGWLGKGARKTTGNDGIFRTPAVPGYQDLHLEKPPAYCDKDSLVWITTQQNEDVIVDDPKKFIVMAKAHRRVEIRVVGAYEKWVAGAKVTLLDKVGAPSSGGSKKPGSAQQAMEQASMPQIDYWTRTTNEQGIATFVYDSPDSIAHFSIRVPNSIYVPKNITVSNIREDLWWAKVTVTLEAGGIVAGSVYAGEEHRRVTGRNLDSLTQKRGQPGQVGQRLQMQEQTGPQLQMQELQTLHTLTPQQFSVHTQTLFKDKLRPPNPPVANAHVFVEGYPELSVYTDQNGDFVLMGVPAGQRIIKASRQATRADSIFIGEQRSITVVSMKTHHLDFFLRPYLGMDLTKLYGFPIELDALQELSGGSVRVSGAFVDVPSNSIFRLKDDTSRIEFADVVVSPVPGAPSPAPAIAAAGSVPVLPASIPAVAYGKYIVDLQGTPSVTVGPEDNDPVKGRFEGNARLLLGSFNLNSNELDFADSGGAQIPMFLGYHVEAQGSLPAMKIAPLVSKGGTLDTRGVPLRLARLDGTDARALLFGYNASFESRTSWLQSNGMHLRTTLHVLVQSCGSSMGSNCDVALSLGEQTVGHSGLEPLDASAIPAQDIQLQKWILHAETFAFAGSYLSFSGTLKAPLLANLDNEQTRLNIPFQNIELQPDRLIGGSFNFTELDILGIAKMKFTHPFTFAVDAQSWFITSTDPYVSGDLGSGKHLDGMTTSTKILLDNFYLRSDGHRDITPAQASYVAWDVSHFQPTSFQFDYLNNKAILMMQGSLDLINVPEFGYQATRFMYTAGGKFTMDPVFLNEPMNAGGVQVSIAGGVLGPDGFVSEGDHGVYRNRVILQGSFSLNMWFRHRKVGSGFSTIAEIINPNHNPPQNQALFHNADGTDVWSVYGRTQKEPDQSWTTNLAGWYRTQELAGKDSMYYVVVGTGGHGSVNAGNGTLKMKGTSGGLSMLRDGAIEQFPKGPPEAPPEEESDGPFSNFTIRMDFEMLAIIASVDINAEISGGVTFTGNITTVLAFGPKKFWSFFAAGKGEVANPPCNGSAVFLAGANYEVIPEQLQTIIEYSISKRDLPPEFKTITGFFTQVAVTLPIPGTPNFDIDLGFAGLRIECSMGGEARVGLNFQNGTTFFIGLYFTAKVQVDAFIEISAWVLGFRAEAQLLIQVGIGGWFTFNSDAGASFDFMGFIIGKLTFGGCLIVMGEETGCGDFTLFEVGGEVTGRVGNNEFLEITPTFSFLGL